MFSVRNLTLAFALASATAGSAIAADLEPVAEPEAPAPAKIAENYYISVFGGVNLAPGEEDFANDLGGVVEVDRDTGFAVGGAIGYKWVDINVGGFTPRTEFEFSYFENNVGEVDFNLNALSPEVLIGEASIDGYNFLFNGYLDYDGFNNGFTPYVTAGLGLSVIDLEIIYNGVLANLNDNSTNLVWSIGAGGSYEFTENISFFADARYQQHQGVDSERLFGAAPAPGAGTGNFESSLGNVLVRGGVTYNF